MRIERDLTVHLDHEELSEAVREWVNLHAVGLDKGMLKDDAIYIINGLGPLDRTVVTGNFKDLAEHLRP